MRIEGHAHIFMDGINYKEAVRIHKNHPSEVLIREHLAAYQKAGITWVRDGGDAYGACSLAREIAGEYGITYRIPVFAIHKNGYYGKIVGKGFDTFTEYKALVREAKEAGADFIKIMTTSILDFADRGALMGPSLPRQEVFDMIAYAHDMGMSVMSHTNGAREVIDAAEAGVDSVEHGNFQNEESLMAIREAGAVWVPTLVTVQNLLKDPARRFPPESVLPIVETQREIVQRACELSLLVAPGSDAGAYMVGHGSGIQDEWEAFYHILGTGEEVKRWLGAGEDALIARF